MESKTLPFDAADAFDNPKDQAALLAEALESADAAAVTAAPGLIARAHGISQMARDAGISREAIYHATSPDGNPTLSTSLALVKSAGIKLSAAA